MFYDGRTYQGAKGPMYPYVLVDRLSDTAVDKTYRVVWLENEYVKLGILPDLGGRIWVGQDKTNGYNFFYHQYVIKPCSHRHGRRVDLGRRRVEHPASPSGVDVPCPSSTASRRKTMAARRCGWASWSCATGCGGPSA